MKKLAFVGAGSHADAIRPFVDEKVYDLVGYFDDKDVEFHDGLPVIGRTSEVTKMLDLGVIDNVFITVGDNTKRAEWFENVAKNHYDAFINIIAPTAVILEKKSLKGKGIFVGSGAFVGRNVTIGDNVIVNTHAIVEHHSKVHSHVNLTPNAVIAGFVELETGVYMGLSSSAIQLVTVSEWSVVGAGAVVVKSLTETGTYVGVPARKIGDKK